MNFQPIHENCCFLRNLPSVFWSLYFCLCLLNLTFFFGELEEFIEWSKTLWPQSCKNPLQRDQGYFSFVVSGEMEKGWGFLFNSRKAQGYLINPKQALLDLLSSRFILTVRRQNLKNTWQKGFLMVLISVYTMAFARILRCPSRFTPLKTFHKALSKAFHLPTLLWYLFIFSVEKLKYKFPQLFCIVEALIYKKGHV